MVLRVHESIRWGLAGAVIQGYHLPQGGASTSKLLDAIS